jgi:Tfp pilus assembly protein PilO
MIIYGLGGLLAASIVFFLFSFAYTSLETMSAQNIQSRLDELQQKVERQRKDYEEWKNVEQEYNSFKENYLVNSERFDGFKQDVQMAFRKNGVTFSRLEYGIKSMFSDVVKISVKSEFTGSYQNIKRFIYDMENKKEIVLFRKLQLGKKKGETVVEGELAMEVYFVK